MFNAVLPQPQYECFSIAWIGLHIKSRDDSPPHNYRDWFVRVYLNENTLKAFPLLEVSLGMQKRAVYTDTEIYYAFARKKAWIESSEC